MRNSYSFACAAFLFTFILSASNSALFAQVIQLQDTESKKPVKDAFIINDRNNDTQLTDAKGSFSTINFQHSDSILIQHPGYGIFKYSFQDIKDSSVLSLTKNVIDLDAFVFSARRAKSTVRETPNHIAIIGTEQLPLKNVQTTADLLESSGEVAVQKSQAGGGSPIIRGFEANKILLVVDGVRMNNAIYRGGHLQNVITLDNNALEKAEVLFGAGAVPYGSDALGGVIHFYTKNPKLSNHDSINYEGGGMVRLSSANNEFSTNIDVGIGGKKLGSYTNISVSKFGHTRMGGNRKSDWKDNGYRTEFIQRVNNRDSIYVNPDSLLQIQTGYRQINVLQKILYRPSAKFETGLNLQFSTSTDVPRYDQLTSYSKGRLKFSEWSYGPQNRLFSAWTNKFRLNSTLADRLITTLGYQRIQESRITRRLNQVNRTTRTEDVDVFTANIDFYKDATKSLSAIYGFDYSLNNVASSVMVTNIETGVSNNSSTTRYPDGGSTMQQGAFYALLKEKFNSWFIVDVGGRYNFASARSSYVDTATYSLPFKKISSVNNAFSGTGSLTFLPFRWWKIAGVFYSGFRVPNVDDYGKVFAKSDFVVVPTDELKPEFTYSGEFNTMINVKNTLVLSLVGYYTQIKDAIVRKPASINGQDSLMYDGEMLRVNKNVNANEAYIYGVNGSAKLILPSGLSAKGTLTYTVGRNVSDNVPLGHIPPLFGRVELNYIKKKISASVFSNFNGAKQWEDYSFTGEDNEDQAVEGVGTPSWVTLNGSVMYAFNTKINLKVGVNNWLDSYYRPFASGVSAPGRNFIVELRVFI